MAERTPLLPARAAFPGPRLLWRTGAAFVAAGIVTGAFGAHAIKSRVTPAQAVSWGTASQYVIYTGLGLLAISLHPRYATHRFAGPAIAAGCVLFSGSIFALVLDKEKRFPWLGPITPLGGTLMIAGFTSLIF